MIVSGTLQDVKANHGNKRIVIETEHPMPEIDELPGVLNVDREKNELQVSIEDESVAESVYQIVTQYGFVRRFQLMEPTLNEIFIDKVGELDG